MFDIMYNYWPRYNKIIDYFYAKGLRYFGHNKILRNEELGEIKRIQRLAYGESMSDYQIVNTVEEFIEGIGCYDAAQLDYIIEEGFYCLCVKHYNCIELYDMASESRKYAKILHIIADLFKKYSQKCVYSKSRTATSYPLFKTYEKRGKIEILNDMKRISKGEEFHLITIRAKKNK